MTYYYGIPKTNSEMCEIANEISKHKGKYTLNIDERDYIKNKERCDRFIRILTMVKKDVEIEIK